MSSSRRWHPFGSRVDPMFVAEFGLNSIGNDAFLQSSEPVMVAKPLAFSTLGLTRQVDSMRSL